jgi:hypothetical protein
MEYYRIMQKSRGDYITPQYMTMTEIWSDTQPVLVLGHMKTTASGIAFLPFYTRNVFFISDTVKKIWKDYQKGGRYRACAFGSVEHKQVRPYCFMMPVIVDCIHENTRYKNNGEIEVLYLDREQVGMNKVFGVKAERKIHLILSEDVLEEMIRNSITEFDWEEVQIIGR